MGKNQSASNLPNIIQYSNGSINFVSGSTLLMQISSSGAITTTGVISGSNALSSSYAVNSDQLDGFDSTAFVFTSSFNTYSSSMSTRTSNLESTSSTLTTASASFAVVSSSYSTASGSLSTRVTKIEGNYATTGSNIFTGAQTVCANITSTGTIIAQTLNVQQVTSSIVYSSGSNTFGCLLTDRQQFTGSVTMTGSLNVAGNTCVVSICSPAHVGGTFSGTTVYGSTAICGGTVSGTTGTFSSSVTASGDILANGSSIFTKAASGGYQISLNAQASTQKFRFDDLTGSTYGVLAFEAGNGSGGFVERMRITSAGKVAINDNVSLDSLFTVNTKCCTQYNAAAYLGNAANIRLTNGAACIGAYSGVSFGGGGATEGFFGIVQNSTCLAEFVWQTYNGSAYGERMRITSGGNVGIGIATPCGIFHTQATNSGIYFDLSTAYTPKIIAAGTISDIQIQSVGNGGNIYLNAPGTTSAIEFSTNGTQSTGRRMVITSGGNVGINNTTPCGKLQITLGTVANGCFRNVAAEAALTIEACGNSYLQFMNCATSQTGIMFGNTCLQYSGMIWYRHDLKQLMLGANNTEILYLCGGNVGINCASPSEKLTIEGNIKITSGNCIFYCTGAGYYGKMMLWDGANGNFLFQNASGGSGHAGWLPQGNFGIGTCTPSAKLHVNGGNFYVTNASTTNQVVVGSTTAASSGVSKNIAFVDHTHTLLVKLYVIQSTAHVGMLVQTATTAYGANNMGTATTAYLGNISGVSLTYNNTGYYLAATITYTGSAPTIYWVIEGISAGTIATT